MKTDPKGINEMASDVKTENAIREARERVARCAEKDGEFDFAAEVRSGCWDHRRDVQAALRGEKLRGE